MVLLSGGTSKGTGDVSYRVVGELGPPGIVAHGVALKPGKPLCLAAVDRAGRHGAGRGAAGLSDLGDLHLSRIHRPGDPPPGRPSQDASAVVCRPGCRCASTRSAAGRSTFSSAWSAGVARADVAYPMGKGSGSVTTFSRADGFVVIPRQREYLEAGDVVDVHLLGQGLRPADLVVIGSHCVGLDYLLGRLQERACAASFSRSAAQAG